MLIKNISAKTILDSRKEKTILVSIKTNVGEFSASSPNGKSTGKYEAKSYVKNIEHDIKTIKEIGEYFSDEEIEKFDDLRTVEDIADSRAKRVFAPTWSFDMSSISFKSSKFSMGSSEKYSPIFSIAFISSSRLFL